MKRRAEYDAQINVLGLEKCQNTLIGIPGRIKGISGGEKKRLAFASEVLTNPRLMFCDEPTSGLDSFMAQNIVDVMRTLAKGGRTILCTIHQPSSQVYVMFDRLLLLADGRVAYLGPAKSATTFFSSMNYQCPSNFNPADFLVNALAIVPEHEEESRARVEEICDGYEKTSEYKSLIQSHRSPLSSPSVINQSELSSPYKAGWFTQFGAVMWRSWLGVLREPLVIKVRTMQTILIALILGVIYLNTDYTQEGIQNVNGLMFLLLTNMTFQNMFAVVNVFCSELAVFLREHHNGMYRTDVYYLSRTLAEMPLFILLPIVFTTICYWMVGLYNDVMTYLISCLIVTIIANVSVSFGYMISCLTNDVTVALSVAAPLIIPLMLFGGFFLNANSVPVYFIWLEYLSWFKYGNEAITVNQWKDVTDIKCTNTVGPCVRNGTQVLSSLNFNEDNLWFDIGMLGVLLVGYRFVGFLCLLIRARVTRGK